VGVKEGLGLVANVDAFNLFNRVQFANPNVSAGNPSFGVISSQSNTPRLIQFALRLMY